MFENVLLYKIFTRVMFVEFFCTQYCLRFKIHKLVFKYNMFSSLIKLYSCHDPFLILL